MTRLATLVVIALAAVVSPAAAQGPDYTLRAKGSVSGPGKVTGIGGFKPQSDPSLAAATAVFGPPTSRREEGSSCIVGWRPIGLKILFANFSTGSACEFGSAQSAAAFGRVWHTPRGLKIGDSVRRLRRLYPGALRRGHTYRLVGGRSVAAGGRYSVLAAKTNGRQVKAFKLFVGAAGE